jgi:hypothetical protein
MKSYKQFITESIELWSRIDKKCKKYGIENYTINSDGSIDVNGHVDISDKNLKKIPLKFRDVSGDFDCSSNQLTTLEGSPKSVIGGFYCFNNQLTTLRGAPKSVVGGFHCGSNQLTTLEGSPKSVGGYFHCSRNQLTTLEGAPKSVGGNFYCSFNQLVDLRGFPEYYDGDVYYGDNPVSEILDLFARKVVGGELGRIIDIINDYDVIQGNKVVLDRLEEVYYQLDMTPPNNIKLTNYEIWE